MPEYYKNKTPCYWEPAKCCIYQIATTKKPRSWYVRVKKQGTGYHQESLETSNKELAMEKAKNVWRQYRNAEDRGVTYGNSDFNSLFMRFLDGYTWGAHRYIRVSHIYKRFFSDYFGKIDIQDVDNGEWKRYLDWRLDYWAVAEAKGQHVPGNAKRKPSQATIRSERQLLVQFLKWCNENGHLASVPSISVRYDAGTEKRIEMKRTRGLPMTAHQYASAIKRLSNWSMKQNDEDHWIRRYARQRLFFFILITTSCLLRMGTEATNLKWKHLDFFDSKRYPGTKIACWRITHGKTGGRDQPAVSTYAGTLYILRWLKLCKEYGFGKPDDYVFANWDGERVPTFYLNKTLTKKLAEWGITETPAGTRITLYSFRATAISRRIVKAGWDIQLVAEAANTSIATISKHYTKEWVEAAPDRLADTSRDRTLYLSDKDASEVEELLNEFGL